MSSVEKGGKLNDLSSLDVGEVFIGWLPLLHSKKVKLPWVGKTLVSVDKPDDTETFPMHEPIHYITVQYSTLIATFHGLHLSLWHILLYYVQL